MLIRLLCRKRHKKKFLIPLMNEGLGELRCRRHFFYGNVILPFVDKFPQDTELYRIMTTKPEEVKGDN